MGKNKNTETDIYEAKLSTLKDKFYSMVECGANKSYDEIDAEELGEVVDMLKDVFEACYYLNAAKYYCTVTEAMDEADQEEKEMYMNKYLPETREWYGGMNNRMYPYYYGGRYPMKMARRRDSRGRFMYGGDMDMMDYGYDPMRMDEWNNGKMYYFDENEHWPDHNKEWYSGGSGNSRGMNTNAGNSGQYGNTGGTSHYGGMTRDPREGRSGMSRKMYMDAKEQNKSKEERQRELESYTQELTSDITEMISNMDTNEKTILKQKIQALAGKIQ